MELRQLTIFRAVAKTLNFTRAAANLNYVQSNVTAQIHALEGELGVPLFDHLGGKQVALTNAGRQLLEYAERLLDLAEEAQTTVSMGGEPQGTLKNSTAKLCYNRTDLQAGCSESERQITNANTRRAVNHTRV